MTPDELAGVIPSGREQECTQLSNAVKSDMYLMTL